MRPPAVVAKISDLVFSQISTHRRRHAVERLMSAIPIVKVVEIDALSREIAFVPEKCLIETLAPNGAD